MPIEYKIYGCQFKCGHKHVRALSNMIKHEKQCWYNTEVKSCLTCKYGELVHEYDPHDEMESCPAESYRYRICNHSIEANDKYDEYTTKLKADVNDIIKRDLIDIKPKINCEYWCKK